MYLLGFNNGVYDTRTKTFRDGKPDDYISKSVGYDFPRKAEKYSEDIVNLFKKIYPNKEVKNMLTTTITNP